MTILGALMGFLLLSGGTPSAEAKEEPVIPSYTVALTGYNAVPEQTDDSPFETASGAYSNPEIIAARTVDLAEELPFGTIIEIDGSTSSSGDDCGYQMVKSHIGYRVIGDSMNRRLTNRVDVLFSTDANYTGKTTGVVRNAADVIGICRGTTVRVVGYVDVNRIPKTQAELVQLVKGVETLAKK
jgi:3D (Asp-Asp-Asp) domain-containing protein